MLEIYNLGKKQPKKRGKNGKCLPKFVKFYIFWFILEGVKSHFSSGSPGHDHCTIGEEVHLEKNIFENQLDNYQKIQTDI